VSHVSGPDAIWNEEEQKLFLYYHGENNITRLASSTDGIHFGYEGVCVSTADFDQISEASYARIMRYPLPEKGSRYLMLLMGNNRGTRKIYKAWSKDGRKWETQRTPFMEPQTRTGQLCPGFLLPWRGKQYLVYHDFDLLNTRDFNANVCDLHVSEVDASFEQTRYLGVFYDHRSAGPDNLAQMSATLVEEGGTLYLFSNIGPRLHQKIALATAPAESVDGKAGDR
jgi:hypothetical protein